MEVSILKYDGVADTVGIGIQVSVMSEVVQVSTP